MLFFIKQPSAFDQKAPTKSKKAPANNYLSVR